MLLAASMDARRPTRMHISMQPRDEEQATLMLASNDRHLATADVPAPKVPHCLHYNNTRVKLRLMVLALHTILQAAAQLFCKLCVVMVCPICSCGKVCELVEEQTHTPSKLRQHIGRHQSHAVDAKTTH